MEHHSQRQPQLEQTRSLAGRLGSKQPYQLDNGTTIGNRIYVYSYVGHEMYHLYGHGYVRAPEGSYYLDENGNKVDCSGQKIISSNGMPLNPKTSPLIDLGRVNPTWTGGLNMNFRIKNVTVSMDFSAQVGGHAYSTTNFLLSYQGRPEELTERTLRRLRGRGRAAA